MKPAVIIPVLNEACHIDTVISKILAQRMDLSIIFVDGGSTDGTLEILKGWTKKTSNTSVVYQTPGTGYGTGLVLGFKKALTLDCDPILTMDGDQSHDPKYFQALLRASLDYELVICSRYYNGVRVNGWRFRKLLLSKLATMFISYILVKPIWDFTSGYRCYRRSFLERIDLDELAKEAYGIQIQIIHMAYMLRARVKEIPFIFEGNRLQESKVSKESKFKTFLFIYHLRAPVSEILRHLFYLKKDYRRFVEEYEELLNPPMIRTRRATNEASPLQICIGLLAHNEENIIGWCLEALGKKN